MPRRDESSGFPQVSSMPSIRKNRNNPTSNWSTHRSNGAENLRKISSTANPFGTLKKSYPPISVSTMRSCESDDDDEAQDQLTEINETNHLKFPVESVIIKSPSTHSHQRMLDTEKAPSMMSLRRRQPQGNRALKPIRILNKGGDGNVGSVNMPQKSRRFMKDFVHTLVDTQWRWVISVYLLTYFGSWTLFAILYYLVGWAHGDLEFDEETGQRLGEGAEECFRGSFNFIGFFLLSVESQVTTGYGARYPTEECPEAIFVLIMQITFSVIIDATMIGIVYVKIIRPPKYASYKFGKNAVICQRDGKLCLLFRVADFKQAQAIDSKVRAYLFEEKITAEGERAGKIQTRLKLENNGRVLLIWPQTVCHFIDRTSPFYDMSARDLIEKRFEILISLSGNSSHTGMTTQTRTSYLSSEILWGNRFTNVISYDSDIGSYVTHIEKLDDVEQVDTALCSARRLDEIIREIDVPQTIDNYPIEEDISTCGYDDEEDDDDYDENSQSGELLAMKETKN